MTIILITWLSLAAPAFMTQPLSPADRTRLEQGEIIRTGEREQGTQVAGYGIGIFHTPLDVTWQALISLPLYDKFVKHNVRSVLLDEKTKDRVVACKLDDPDQVEKLFTGNDAGFSKPDSANPGHTILYSYQRTRLPWPLSDHWVLLEMNHDPKNHIQTWKRLAGTTRADQGVWRLEAYGPNQTLGYMEIHLDMAIPATGFLSNFAMNLSLPDTYHDFESIAQHLLKTKPAAHP